LNTSKSSPPASKQRLLPSIKLDAPFASFFSLEPLFQGHSPSLLPALCQLSSPSIMESLSSNLQDSAAPRVSGTPLLGQVLLAQLLLMMKLLYQMELNIPCLLRVLRGLHCSFRKRTRWCAIQTPIRLYGGPLMEIRSLSRPKKTASYIAYRGSSSIPISLHL